MLKERTKAIGRIARLLPHVVDDSQVSLVRDEWKAYQAETVPADWFLVEKVNGDTEYKRVDDYWNKVLTIKLPSGERKYNFLAW